MAVQCNVTIFLPHCAISAPRGLQDPPTLEAVAPPTLIPETKLTNVLEPQLIFVLPNPIQRWWLPRT